MSANSATRGTRVRASRTRPQKGRISPGRCYGAETSPTVHARRKKWRANIYRRQLTKAGVRDNRKRCTRGSMRGPLRGSSRAVSTYSNQRRVPGPPHKVGRPIKANVSHKADTSTYSTGRIESTTKIQRISDDNRRQHLQTRLNRRDRVGRHGPGH